MVQPRRRDLWHCPAAILRTENTRQAPIIRVNLDNLPQQKHSKPLKRGHNNETFIVHHHQIQLGPSERTTHELQVLVLQASSEIDPDLFFPCVPLPHISSKP